MSTKLPVNIRKFHTADTNIKWIKEGIDGFQVQIERRGGERIKTWKFDRNGLGEMFSHYWFCYLSRAILQQKTMGLQSLPEDVLILSNEETTQLLAAVTLR